MEKRTLHETLQNTIETNPIVGPYRKHKLNLKPIINLADNLNHFVVEDEYPPFESETLKEAYKKVLILDDGELDFVNKEGVDIFFINGALEAINLILKSFCQYGDHVLTFTPTFPFYKDICARSSLSFHEIPLIGENLEKLDIEKAKKYNPKVIIVCDPNNPVSTRIDEDDINQLLKAFPESIIVIDETYIDFSDYPSNLRLLKEYKHLIVVRGLSKGWGMAALRICAIVGSEIIIECLKRLSVPYPVSKNAIETALYRFTFTHQKTKETWETIKKEKKILMEKLSDIKEIKKIYESDTNFLCIKLSQAEDLYNYLMSKGLLVEKTTHIIPESLRITVGKQSENETFIRLIQSYFKSQQQ